MASSDHTAPGLLTLIREDWEVNGRSWSAAGFHALAVHRFGNWRASRPRWAQPVLKAIYAVLYRFVRNVYGIELHEQTRVGRRVEIAHQSGIVIHPRAVIGDGCLIRHNVTLGAAGARWDPAPILGTGVELGAGVVILGGVTIGDGARIGPNAVVMKNVPPGTIVFTNPARSMSPKPGTSAGGSEAPE